MKVILSVAVAIILTGTYSCSNETPQIRRASEKLGSLDANRSTSNITISLSETPEYDAFDYTFGALGLELNVSGSATFSVAALGKGNISTEDENLLRDLCSDITLGSSPDAPLTGNSLEIESGKPIYIFWRSHYPARTKEALSSLLATGQIHCSVSITVQSDSVDLVLNPIPVNTASVAGTSKAQESVDEVIMVIDKAGTGTVLGEGNPYKVLEISSPGDILLGVQAVNSNDVQVNDGDSETICRLHMLNGETKLGNPDEIQGFAYSLASVTDISLGEIKTSSSGGRNLEACGQVTSTTGEGGINMEVACSAYIEIQEQGQGDTCGWYAEISNNQDPKNSVDVGLRMRPLELEKLDLSTPMGSLKSITKQANNPVTLNTVDISSFNDAQQASLERAFDFWIGASPASYTNFWEGNMNKINYLANTQDCSINGVLAFVTSLNTDEMFWCQLAGMRQQDLTEQGSPLVLMLVSITALHENLHAIGNEHDFDARNYQPCRGTSESAVISFDVVTNCQADSCFGMKDLAIQEYIFELDYSLQNDNRRFQGQCQIWNQGLGLNQNDFN